MSGRPRAASACPADLPAYGLRGGHCPGCAALAADLAALSARVAALEAGRGPRDAEDQALVIAIGVATKGLDFSTPALWRHASVDTALSEAFEAADVDNARQLGKLLRRVAGHDVAGWRVERVGADREGIRWRMRVCESETRGR